MEEDKRVADTVDAEVEKTTAEAEVHDDAPVAEVHDDTPVAEDVPVTPKTEEKPESATEDKAPVEEDEDISGKLRRAGERIDRASTEADVFIRRREKDSATKAEIDDDKVRESERKKLEEENRRREAAAEEKRAKMEYAESYRARIRAEKENNAALKRKAEEKERAKAEEKSAREREIAEGIEREREEARARSERAESLLSKTDGSVASAGASVEESAAKADTPTPVSSESASGSPASDAAPVADKTTPVAAPVAVADKPEPVAPVEKPTAPSTPTEEDKSDYVIKIEEDAPKKDILYIDGSTACEITLGVTAAPAAVPATASTPTTASTPATAPATATASATPAPAVSTPTAPAATDKDYCEVARDTAATTDARTYDEYSSMISTVKGEDVPTKPAELATGTPVGDYEADRELLRHASEVTRKEYVTTKRGEDFDITPKYPDPVGTPLTPKEAKRREKEAIEEERRALLEFDRASRKKSIGKAKKTADERALEEYESAEEARRAVADSDKAAPAPTDKKEAPVSTVAPAYPDPVPAKSTPATASEPKRPTVKFDKNALIKNKKRQEKNDLLLIEHRIYAEIRRLEMEARSNEISFAARIEVGKDKRDRSKKRVQLTDTREKLKLAKKYETADNARYYNVVLTDLERVRLPKKTDRDEVVELRERLISLLKQRDDLNLKLIELYSLSKGGKAGKAEGRFNAEYEGKKRAFKRQIPIYKKFERARISIADKEAIYPLMDERTELSGELAKINYMLKKEKPTGLARKELIRDKRKVERKLDENKRTLMHKEKKALKTAERKADGNRAAIIGWSIIGILILAGVLIAVFWKDIQPWFMSKGLPWLTEKFNQLVEWVTSLASGGSGADAAQ